MFGCQNKPKTKKIKVARFREDAPKNQVYQNVEIRRPKAMILIYLLDTHNMLGIGKIPIPIGKIMITLPNHAF